MSSNGLTRAQKYMGLVVATLAVIGALSGVIYAWSDVSHRAGDNSRRIDRIERLLEKQSDTLDDILDAVKEAT